MFDYICLSCGKTVYPHKHEGDCTSVLYDIAPLLFGDASRSTHNLLLPLLMTAEEIEECIDYNAPKTGEFYKGSMTVKQLFTAISRRMDQPAFADITFQNIFALTSSTTFTSVNTANTDEFASSVSDFGSSSDFSSDWGDVDSFSDDLGDTSEDESTEDTAAEEPKPAVDEEQSNPAFYLIDTGKVVADNKRALISQFYSLIIDPFNADGKEQAFTFLINLHKTRIDGKEVLLHYGFREKDDISEIECTNVMVCGNCFRRNGIIAPTLIASDWAWRYEHLAVGFIGAPNSGKTCLITAILSMLLKTQQMQIHLPKNDNDPSKTLIRNCLNDYSENTCLPKTDADGNNSFNATVLLAVDDVKNAGASSSEQNAVKKIVTFVDISGECFDMDSGTFDRIKAAKYFQMIKICRCYILCLDPENKAGSGAKSTFATEAIHEFMRYQSNEVKTVAPLLISITKGDNTPNFDSALEYNRSEVETILVGNAVQTTSQTQRDQQKKALQDRMTFEFNLRNNGEETLKTVFSNFYNSFATTPEFYTSIVNCSAYGTVPKPSKETRKSYADAFDNQSKYLCMSDDGCFIAVNDHECDEDEFYRLYRGSDKLFHVIRNTEDAVVAYSRLEKKYVWGSVPDGYEPVKLHLCSYILSEGASEVSIFWNDDYQEIPQPRNIRLVSEWILRVCGLRPIWYPVENQIFNHYLLSGTDTLDVHEIKYPKTVLAHCARSLFYRITNHDTYVLEEEGHPIKLRVYTMTHSRNNK